MCWGWGGKGGAGPDLSNFAESARPKVRGAVHKLCALADEVVFHRDAD